MDKSYYRIFFKVQQKHWWFVVKKKIILDTINRLVTLRPGSKILDIGCGAGLMLNALDKLGPTSGMDVSDDAISFSKEIFNGEVRKGTLPNEIPYDDHYFTLITALDVIEHVDDDVAALQAIRSKTAADGYVIITVPAFMFLWSEHDVLNEHRRRYSLPELNAKLVRAGFAVEKISYFNTLLFPLIGLVRLFNKSLGRKGGSDVDLPHPAINLVLKVIFNIELFLLRFIRLPVGVSVLAVVRNKV